MKKKKQFDFALVFDFGAEKGVGASIHTLFVFFSIDAVFLNAEKKVVDIARGLKPFALNFSPKQKARYLIELPAGNAKEIEIGDALTW